MGLDSRIKSFDRLASHFDCSRPSPLIAVHKISPELFNKLQVATAVYMSKCLGTDKIILDEVELLEQFEKRENEIPNITPNGMIVPKRHTVLEYNQLVQAFSSIISSLGIDDLILSWHIPLNLRIKFGGVSEENMKRHHPTEDIHSDSWAGESSESVTTMIAIFGDIPRNHIVFYDPPRDFDENWLQPRPTYKDGKDVAKKYSKNELVPEKGDLILSDFAELHASHRLPGAKTRVSIDTTFVSKKVSDHEGIEKVHKWREGERASNNVIRGIGGNYLFYFSDDPGHHVDSEGGFKHCTNLKLIPLKDE